MRREERLQVLRNALQDNGMLHLREAAAQLGVSPMTVRRDLSAAGPAFDFLGGYIMPPVAGRQNGYRFEVELDAHAEAKAAACAEAAKLVEPDDTVFIDCGTTTPHLANRLPTGLRLTVVCYALNIANLVASKPNVRTILLGGEFNSSSDSFFGEEALRTLDRIAINKAFVSAGGIHRDHGVSCSNFHEVPIKQAAMRRSVRRYLVIDESKVGKVKPAPFATMADFHSVIGENGAIGIAE